MFKYLRRIFKRKRVRNVKLANGMGDALNARSFLINYCEKLKINQDSITVFTDRHKIFFEGDNFVIRDLKDCHGKYNFFFNIGHIQIPKLYHERMFDIGISKNTGVEFSARRKDNLNWAIPNISHIPLPKKFVTVNYGFDNLSDPNKEICAKVWPLEYWENLVKNIGIDCVQIGAGRNCKHIKGVKLDLVDKLTIKETAEVMKKAVFHIDTEGGLVILNHHLGGKSVVLFGPTPINIFGKEGNLSITKNSCPISPCEGNPKANHGIYMKKDDIKCDLKCMKELTPDYVIQQIYKNGWLS